MKAIDRGPAASGASPAATEGEPLPSPPAPLAPAGTGAHVVEPGETLVSVAETSGHFWQTIWDDPANAALRAARGDANAQILLPGDRLTIPPLRRKQVACATGQVHRFRRRGIPAKVFIRVLAEDGTPFANRPYVLHVRPHEYRGTTTADGSVEHFVVASAREGALVVDLGADHDPPYARWSLRVGFLDPGASLTGLQGRLAALGFYEGGDEGTFGEPTANAIRRFQTAQQLAVTGTFDAATLDRLTAAYGV
jgi:N-acetylmuramoyl-L-alanine amidase